MVAWRLTHCDLLSYSWVVIFIACIRLTRFLYTVAAISMRATHYEEYEQKAILEFLQIVRVVALVIIFLILVATFSSKQGMTDLARIFADVNVITGTLVVLVAPLLRALLGGLSLISDRVVRKGDAIELCGVAPAGRVISIELWSIRIASFFDGAVYQIPCNLFMKYGLLNLSKKGFGKQQKWTRGNETQLVRVKLPIAVDTPHEAIRTMIDSKPEDVSEILVDEDFFVTFYKPEMSLASSDTERTDLMLQAVQILRDHSIALRL